MKNERGVSLIVLIVTIIVIIILAATVILIFSKNNPIENAREAKFKEDICNIEDEFSMYLSSKYAEDIGNFDLTKINLSGDDMVAVLPSTKEYKEKLKVVQGCIYILIDGMSENEIIWAEELGLENIIISAKTVTNEAQKYYGKYVLNYSTGDTELDENIKWQIFHSDGNNIYLISTDYINEKYVPLGKKGSLITKNTEYKLSFENVYNDYEGSKDILENSKAKKWINLVDKYENSQNENIRAVAYMLDTSNEVWGKFKGEKAEYAIGGPTIELFVASYNKIYDIKLSCEETTVNGYKIKIGDTNYNYSVGGLAKSEEINNLYAITAEDRKAEAMWIASPGCIGVKNYNVIRGITVNGYIGNDGNSNKLFGIRPLICLKQDVLLYQNSKGLLILN